MIKVKSAVLGLGLAALGGCYTVDSHVTWQPSGVPQHDHPYQSWWNYQFVYFPQQQVYFEPYTEEYFWFDDGQWERGTQLPPDVSVDPAKGRIVRLQHQEPFRQHHTVLQWSWPYTHAPAGALDAIHRTDDAMALMEKRRVWRESGVIDTEGWETRWSEAQPAQNDAELEQRDQSDLLGSAEPTSNE